MSKGTRRRFSPEYNEQSVARLSEPGAALKRLQTLGHRTIRANSAENDRPAKGEIMLATTPRTNSRGFVGMGLVASTGLAGAGFLPVTQLSSDDDPVSFVRSLGQQSITLLANETLSPANRKRAIRKLLIDRFDMPLIGHLVMGRHWRRITKTRSDLFVPLFEDFVLTTCSHRLDAYSGVQLTVGRAHKPDKKVMAVGSQVIRGQGQPVDVDRMLHRTDGRWYVIEGVSMVISQRSEFATVIGQRGGIDGLIGKLRTRIDVVSADRQR